MKDGDVLCWKTPASTRKRKRTIRPSSPHWPSSAISTSTTPSPPRTAPTPRPKASATCCRPMPAAPCRPSSRRSARRWTAPTKPVVAIVGGAKVSTKLDLLENLVTKVDALVIGGGMANTFLHAQGVDVGKSLCEKDLAGDRAADHRQGGSRQLRDHPAGRRRRRLRVQGQCAVAGLRPRCDSRRRHDPRRRPAIDRARFTRAIDDATTLVWNGPFGAFEMTPVRPRHRRGGASTRRSAPRPASCSRSPAAATRWRR